jgi:serine/threonine-protein kinase HipA
MARRAEIYYSNTPAGILTEDENGYVFTYYENYIHEKDLPVSLTLPLNKNKFRSSVLFPFFDGLIPEGWLLDIAENTWKINPRDRMGLLLACCGDCIGAVTVKPLTDGE